MKLYHQLGFRYKWNIESYKKGNGQGFIFSPINIAFEDLEKIDLEIKKSGFFDPQIYFPKDSKSKLQTYEYFPNQLNPDFQTVDFESLNFELAKKCIELQVQCDFGYLIIPTRYFEMIPSTYYEQLTQFFVEPYIKTISETESTGKKVILTVIVKQEILIDENNRDILLNWITSINEIDGVYLIFENSCIC